MIKVGTVHIKSLLFLSTPSLYNLSNSFLRVTTWIFVTKKALWCLGTASFFNSRCSGLPLEGFVLKINDKAYRSHNISANDHAILKDTEVSNIHHIDMPWINFWIRLIWYRCSLSVKNYDFVGFSNPLFFLFISHYYLMCALIYFF